MLTIFFLLYVSLLTTDEKINCGSNGSKKFLDGAVAAGMNFRDFGDGERIGISLDETATGNDLESILHIFGNASPNM